MAKTLKPLFLLTIIGTAPLALANECVLEPACYGMSSAPNHKTFGLTLGIKKGQDSAYPKERSGGVENTTTDTAKECFQKAMDKAGTLEPLTRKYFDPSLADDPDYVDTVACFPYVKWTYSRNDLKRSGKVSAEARYVFENFVNQERVIFNFTGDQRYKYENFVSDKIIPLLNPEPYVL